MFIKNNLSSGDSVFCYQCSGLACEPDPVYLTPCDNQLNRPIPRCYSVAWNLKNIYRGCYEQEDPFIQNCIDNVFENCAVCEGNGCNNQPLFQPATSNITCKVCPYGVCTETDVARDDYQLCDRFLMTVVPSCYQLLDYEMIAFTFGCTNAISDEDYEFCAKDKSKLSCRFCYRDNCNNFVHSYNGTQGDRISCKTNLLAFTATRICDRFTILTPFTNCFTEINFLRPRVNQFVGCTVSYPPGETYYVTKGVNYYNCWSTNCNEFADIRG